MRSRGLSRRGFVACGGAALGSALYSFGAQRATATTSISTLKSTGPTDPIWGIDGAATGIIRSLRHLTEAAFPAASFPATHYGARQCRVIAQSNPYAGALPSPLSAGAQRTAAPDSLDCRPAFLAAIAACSAAGGGRVVVPAGNWYCAGPIVLLSHVNFHLAARCTIYFSPQPRDYAKDGPFDCGTNGRLYYSRWQGNDCLNFGSPLYARNATRIALTGEGPSSVLNGQAMTPFAGSGNASACWWTYKGIAGKYGCIDAATPSQAYTNPNNRDLHDIVPDLGPVSGAKPRRGAIRTRRRRTAHSTSCSAPRDPWDRKCS
ncbi:MAG TPA: hypothetical protein VIY90_11780 [Steroidobacteraceae bacterium]